MESANRWVSVGTAAVMVAPTSGAATTGITGGATSALIDTAAVVLIDITAMRAAMLAIAMLAIALLLAKIVSPVLTRGTADVFRWSKYWLLASCVVIRFGDRPKPSPRIPGNVLLGSTGVEKWSMG